MPGGFGDTLRKSVTAAIDARTGVGVLGLAGVLLTGLGWIGNVRAAINAMWGTEPPKRNFVQAKLANLSCWSASDSPAWSRSASRWSARAFTDTILRAASLDDMTGVHTLVKIFGIALAVAGDMLVFAWLLVRLPGVRLPARVVLRGSLLAAVGFELLKVGGAYYIARVTDSPAVGLFGSVIGILVWIYLAARYLLYCAAWTATANPPAAVAVDVPPGPRQRRLRSHRAPFRRSRSRDRCSARASRRAAGWSPGSPPGGGAGSAATAEPRGVPSRRPRLPRTAASATSSQGRRRGTVPKPAWQRRKSQSRLRVGAGLGRRVAWAGASRWPTAVPGASA